MWAENADGSAEADDETGGSAECGAEMKLVVRGEMSPAATNRCDQIPQRHIGHWHCVVRASNFGLGMRDVSDADAAFGGETLAREIMRTSPLVTKATAAQTRSQVA